MGRIDRETVEDLTTLCRDQDITDEQVSAASRIIARLADADEIITFARDVPRADTGVLEQAIRVRGDDDDLARFHTATRP